MHDLSERLERWRRELSGLGCPRELVDEGEDHLRCALEEELGDSPQSALDLERAWAAACTRFGSLQDFVQETRKEAPFMSPLSRLFGAALCLAALALGIGTASPLVFVHAPALLFVLGVVLGGLCAGFGPRTLLEAVRTCGGRVCPPEARALHVSVFQRAGQLAWAAGGLGTLLGAIGVAANLSDPAQIGSSAALCLLSLLYGGVLAELVFRTCAQWIRNQELVAKAG